MMGFRARCLPFSEGPADNQGMARRIYTDDDKQRLVELWQAGESLSAIAAGLGTTPHGVAVLACRLRKLGWDVPKREGGSRLGGDELSERLSRAKAGGDSRTIEILELRIAGALPSEIARQLGISSQQVTRRIADRAGERDRAGEWSWRGRCAVCGTPTRSRTSVGDANGPNRHRQISTPAKLCDQHAREARWGRPQLTRENVISELQAMARRLDRTPKITDLQSADAPFGPSQVYRLFGRRGFTVALREAGLVTREARGQDRHDDKATQITWEQRATVLRLGGSLSFDWATASDGSCYVNEARSHAMTTAEAGPGSS